MHTQLIKQITDNVHSDDILLMILVKFQLKLIMIIFIIPNLPEAFISDKNVEDLVKEYFKSPFFIG